MMKQFCKKHYLLASFIASAILTAAGLLAWGLFSIGSDGLLLFYFFLPICLFCA